MKNIKVLGTGCANCKTTQKLIEESARTAGIEIQLEKVEELPQIMSYGIMSTPGVVVDGKLVHAGGIPAKDAIDGWLRGSAAGGCCGEDISENSKCCS